MEVGAEVVSGDEPCPVPFGGEGEVQVRGAVAAVGTDGVPQSPVKAWGYAAWHSILNNVERNVFIDPPGGEAASCDKDRSVHPARPFAGEVRTREDFPDRTVRRSDLEKSVVQSPHVLEDRTPDEDFAAVLGEGVVFRVHTVGCELFFSSVRAVKIEPFPFPAGKALAVGAEGYLVEEQHIRFVGVIEGRFVDAQGEQGSVGQG